MVHLTSYYSCVVPIPLDVLALKSIVSDCIALLSTGALSGIYILSCGFTFQSIDNLCKAGSGFRFVGCNHVAG